MKNIKIEIKKLNLIKDIKDIKLKPILFKVKIVKNNLNS